MSIMYENGPRLAFDPDALRRKYREERDKRLRPHASTQFIDISDEYAAFGQDPFADPDFARSPIIEETDVLVLGAGITGIMTSVELQKNGIKDFRIIDKAADFGGTWYWNRYPGIRCDIESYIYVPYLEELATLPSEKYAKGSEIFAHLQAVGRHFGLYDKALFQTQVLSAIWDEASGRWIAKTDRGDVIKARFITLSSGPISKPKLPGIPGIRDFKGHMFHTARWDYAYTGGNADGDLTGLSDKRVAIIGTGATGVQVIPQVARYAGETLVFQRTPAAVDARDNRKTDPEWGKTLETGWQQERMENFTAIMLGMQVEKDLVSDRWTDVWGKLNQWAKSEDPLVADKNSGELLQLADYEKMEGIRARIDQIVKDRVTAEALKPWYNLFCKRPLYSDDYLPTFNRPSVKLIDTKGMGVERITDDSVVVDGVAYPVDCIIFASGYEVAAPAYKAGNFQIVGKDGVTLDRKWGHGMRSLHGMLVDGFPNMCIIGTIRQAASAINFPLMLGGQAKHCAQLIGSRISENVKSFEVRPEAVDGWLRTLAENAKDMAQFESDCTPGYLNNEGDKGAGQTLFSSTFGGGAFEYFKICEQWRQEDHKTDLEVQKL